MKLSDARDVSSSHSVLSLTQLSLDKNGNVLITIACITQSARA